jgi:hypothetical protein
MGVCPVEKKSACDVLKSCGSAVAVVPAHQLGQMHQFVLEDPLECLEAIIAVHPANGNTSIQLTEPVEQNAARNSDFEAHLAGASRDTRRLSTGTRHARRQPKCESLPVQSRLTAPV